VRTIFLSVGCLRGPKKHLDNIRLTTSSESLSDSAGLRRWELRGETERGVQMDGDAEEDGTNLILQTVFLCKATWDSILQSPVCMPCPPSRPSSAPKRRNSPPLHMPPLLQLLGQKELDALKAEEVGVLKVEVGASAPSSKRASRCQQRKKEAPPPFPPSIPIPVAP
jgi:hypothetical protein